MSKIPLIYKRDCLGNFCSYKWDLYLRRGNIYSYFAQVPFVGHCIALGGMVFCFIQLFTQVAFTAAFPFRVGAVLAEVLGYIILIALVIYHYAQLHETLVRQA